MKPVKDLFIGETEVEAFDSNDGRPLIYFQHRYGPRLREAISGTVPNFKGVKPEIERLLHRRLGPVVAVIPEED